MPTRLAVNAGLRMQACQNVTLDASKVVEAMVNGFPVIGLRGENSVGPIVASF